MNESAAREVLLVRAVEGADSAGKILTPGDLAHAGRAAAELVRWRAAEKGEPATEEAFVAKRAELLVARIAERAPRPYRAFRSLRWRPWIGVAVPLIALAIGAVAEHIADRRHVSILAFPLLGIVAWNLAVYAWLMARAAITRAKPGSPDPGWLRRLVAGVRSELAARAPGPLAGRLASFGTDWARRSGPLVAARAGRVLHLSAALLAFGAIAGMYVRGLAFEYRAGWESTFLDANAVHAIVEAFLLPAAWLLGQALPGVEQIAALRWDGAASGENAARWIHLHATTVVLAVLLPRLALAALAYSRERAFSNRFPLSLEEPYFRRVLGGWRERPGNVRVAAYAYTPSEPAMERLRRLATRVLGEDARVVAVRPVAFGEEDDIEVPAEAEPAPPDLVIALFNLGSTPEIENHGVFLDALKARGGNAFAVIVDESPYRRRLGAQAGAQARLSERRRSWSAFAETRGLRVVFADLGADDLAAAGRELDMQLSTAGAPG